MPPAKGFLIGAGELAVMEDGAILVNAARGGLVDELALDRALRAGKLRGAAIDVLSQEPPDAGHPLLSNDRVTISPHSAGLTDECAARMACAAVQNIVDFFDGSIDRSLIVNFDKIKPKP
jgi:D-3-phosphoglycerate dehydrogenase